MFCCVKFDEIHKKEDDLLGDEESQEKRSFCMNIIYYSFCCCLCPGLCFKKQSASGAAAEGEGMEMAAGEEEGEEANEEDAA